MKSHFVYSIILALTFGLALSIGKAQSQSGDETGGQPGLLDEVAAQISPLITYQGRLTESGIPVTGSRSMTFRLYDQSSGGTLVWLEGPKSITLSNGLFSVTLGDTTPLSIASMDQSLWLEIQVGSTLLPRQQLSGSPYALSLAPGAHVTGNLSGPVLSVQNAGSSSAISGASTASHGLAGTSGTGHGVYAYSNGTGAAGASLWAENTDGIAMWGKTSSDDAAMVVENSGTGNLFKGFGADGGEDELRIGNDGSIASKADTYLFVPGMQAQLLSGGVNASLDISNHGRVTVYPSGAGIKALVLPIPLPGVLYGQAVKVEEVTIYYESSYSGTYIDQTDVYRQRNLSSFDYYSMATDGTNRTSMDYTSYSVPVTNFNVLSAEEGMVTVWLRLSFDSGDEHITIGGVRVRLGHHPLY